MPTTTAEAQRLRVNQLLTLLEERKADFRALTASLKAAQFPTGSGWRGLRKKFDELTVPTVSDLTDWLTKYCEQQCAGGEKQVFVFPISSDEASELASSLEAIEIPASVFASEYPAASADLRDAGNEHVLVRASVQPNGDVCLVLCSVRQHEERIHYGSEQVTSAVRTAFPGFDHFIAIKRIRYQIFDVVNVRRGLERVEVLIDRPDLATGAESPEGRWQMVLGRLVNRHQVFERLYNAFSPLNLAPCIAGIYSSRTEGRIQRVSFRSPSKSNNRAAISDQQDLRDELFHKSGVEAVGGVITPYSIEVLWPAIGSPCSELRAELHMPVAALSTEGFNLTSAKLKGLSSDTALVSAVNKLVAYSSHSDEP